MLNLLALKLGDDEAWFSKKMNLFKKKIFFLHDTEATDDTDSYVLNEKEFLINLADQFLF